MPILTLQAINLQFVLLSAEITEAVYDLPFLLLFPLFSLLASVFSLFLLPIALWVQFSLMSRWSIFTSDSAFGYRLWRVGISDGVSHVGQEKFFLW